MTEDRESSAAALSFDEPVTLAGGGDLCPETLSLARGIAPTVVAADGGANRLRKWSVPVAAVIGDMDSIVDAEFWRRRVTQFIPEDEQNSTDLEKCLRLVRSPLYLAVGFLGSRLDHSIAALGITVSSCAGPIILVAERDIAFPAPTSWEARIPAGARISILATRRVRIGRSSGLRWPPDGLCFDVGTTRGVSNVALGGMVRLAFDRPGALLVMDNEHLREAACSLGHSVPR